MILFVYFSIASAARLPGEPTGSPSSTTSPLYCFLRISTGERLIGYDVTRIVERSTVETCQQECLIYRCTHFGFGSYNNGSGTCELTTGRQVSRRLDPKFDLYERTTECIGGKPTGYEQACYRRVHSGRRLNERFIRHSLPCNSLEACQHQCSIEKHFHCQGFNIRLDPARVGRGICELSSVGSAYLEETKDFSYDPEFQYYERVYSNELANCGYLNNNGYPGVSIYGREGGDRLGPKALGGPYRGADSYGPWTNGYGNTNHGPWTSRGYGSGFYLPLEPSRELSSQFRPNAHHRPQSYGNGGGRAFQGQGRTHVGDTSLQWFPNYPPKHVPVGDGGPYDRPNRIPTYIIIDANANERRYGEPPNSNYLPTKPGQNPSTEESPSSGDGSQTSSPPEIKPESRQESSPTDPQTLPFPTRDAALRPHVYPAKPEDLPPNPPSFPPPLPPPSHFQPPLSRTEPPYSFHLPGREVCFQRAHPGYRLNTDTIRQTYDARTVLDCEAMCTGSPFKCTGYSFRYSSSTNGMPNCLLTDFQSIAPTSHLLPDRSCDVYFKMTTCLDLERTGDTECFLKVNTDRKIDSSKIIKAVSVGGISDCELACLNSYVFTCRSFTFRFGPNVIGESTDNCFLSDWPVSALSPKDFVASPGHDVYERGSYGHGCELDVGPNIIGPVPPPSGYPVSFPGSGKEAWTPHETWRHYTVSGWPCKLGTECRLNAIAGFWSCEVEGGDGEQWDYCCMPRHSCGYSRGHNYPWCYVGEAGPEQWRPCSEHYYPELGNRYPNKPAQNFNSHPDDSFGPPRDEGPWNLGNSEALGPPSYWPISYLYAEPPPNETYIWDEDLHHHYQHEDHLDDGPSIRFKPCCHKFPYPKAIVQKLDLTNESKATDPEDQMLSDGPEAPKKIGYRDAALEPDTHSPYSSPSDNTNQKEDLKNDPINPPKPEQSKRNETEHQKKESKDNGKVTKFKEIIKTVEKIIEENTKAISSKENSQTLK